MANNGPWGEELIEQMIVLFQAGNSASQIAKALPGAFTRNAVIGKLHRLRAMGRIGASINPPHKPVTKYVRPKVWKHRPVKLARVPPPPPIVYEKPSAKNAAILAEATPDGCRYIEGDYRAGDMAQAFMCNSPSLFNSAYCGHHHKLCRTSIPQNNRLERAALYYARR